MAADLFWFHGDFKHRAFLQQFECAPLPYRKAKKLSEKEQEKVAIWASRVQSHVRNLEPAYSQPRYLEIGSLNGGREIASLYYCEDSPAEDGVLRALLGLVSVRKDLQGQQLGEITLSRFLAELGSRAKLLGCTEISVVATVHNSNVPCLNLLERTGWFRIGASETLRDCDNWGIRGRTKSAEDAANSQMPLPLVSADADEAYNAFFADEEPTMDSPMGSAYLWFKAISDVDHYYNALDVLTWDIHSWPDLRTIDDELEGFGIAQKVDYNSEDSDIAYVRFIPLSSSAARAFASAPVYDYRVLTLVRQDGHWFVWGLTTRGFPTRSDVYGTDLQE